MNHFRATCAVFALVVLTGITRGQQAAKDPAEEADQAGPLSFSGVLTIPSSYVFRGYVIEEDHFLFQPELTITYTSELGGVEVAPYVGIWANLTDAPADGEPEWVNEVDLYAGIDLALPHDFSLGFIYTLYNSPADAFDDIHEVGLTLSHGDFLNPAIGIYFEIDNRDTGEENTYIELSLTPGLDIPQIEGLRIDFPLVLGLTPDEYYTDENGDGEVLGYASAGIAATCPLNDNWSLFAGAEYVQMLADSAEESNGGDSFQIVGRAGVSFSY
ncbi:TorF family putative porin [Fontivita pretiosa]|uniref:TorF family putative porin n=1 Tax=Fontivita pretiosa TaxID=2989684 RepID=UPI003D168873